MDQQVEQPNIDLNKADVPRLRSWMPPRKGSGRFVNAYLFYVCVALLFTILIIVASEQLPTVEPDLTWLKILLPTLMSIVLGWITTVWWEHSNVEESIRYSAIGIDDRAEDYIHHIAESWQQTIHALRTLVNSPTSDFMEAANFLLGVQYNRAMQEIERYAIEIDRLGFASNAFLNEKSARFRAVRRQALMILTAMSKEEDNRWIIDVFTKLDPELAMPTQNNQLVNHAHEVTSTVFPFQVASQLEENS